MATPELEYEQTWTSRGNHRLGVQLYPHPEHQTEADADGPLILLVPGMGVPAGYYRPFIRILRQHRIRVAALDLRGTGVSQPPADRRSRYGYAELTADLGAVLDQLTPDSANQPVVLLGHSLGGQLSLLHLATADDKRVAGAALITTGLAYWRSYSGWKRVATLPFSQTVGVTAGVLGVWPGWGFAGRQSKGVMQDWAYSSRTGRLPSINGQDMSTALGAIRTPILAVSVDHDQFTPAATIDQLCRQLRSAPLEREHYPASVTGRVDHFRWARTPGPMANRVAEFARAAVSD